MWLQTTASAAMPRSAYTLSIRSRAALTSGALDVVAGALDAPLDSHVAAIVALRVVAGTLTREAR